MKKFLVFSSIIFVALTVYAVRLSPEGLTFSEALDYCKPGHIATKQELKAWRGSHSCFWSYEEEGIRPDNGSACPNGVGGRKHINDSLYAPREPLKYYVLCSE